MSANSGSRRWRASGLRTAYDPRLAPIGRLGVSHERPQPASCDGPPHCYKPALDEAKAMLAELGAEPPEIT